MTGEKIPFQNEFVKKDDIWLALVSSSTHDLVAGEMLVSIFKAFQLLLDRVLTDLLPVIEAEEDNMEEVHTKYKISPNNKQHQ